MAYKFTIKGIRKFNEERIVEKFFDTFKVVSDTVDFDTSKPIHCLLESETAVKLFSSMN